MRSIPLALLLSLIVASLPGQTPPPPPPSPAGGYITASPGARSVEPGVPIAVRVVDAHGRPVAGAAVAGSSSAPSPDLLRRAERTGADGSAVLRIRPLPPSASPMRVYADAGGVIARSEAFSVPPDSPLTIAMPEAVALTVRVRDSLGGPLAGAGVVAARIWEDEGRSLFHLRIDRESPVTSAGGTLELRLAPGLYDVLVDAEGFVAERVAAHRAGSPLLDIVLQRGAPLRGRVVRADGTPVERAMVNVEHGDDRLHAPVGRDGAFAIHELPPGTAKLSVSSAADGSVDSIPITIPVEDLRVELPAVGTIAGRVTDRGTGAPVTRYTVLVTHHAKGGTQSSGRSVTHVDGAFERSGLAPGDVQVSIQAPGYVPFSTDVRRLEPGGRIDGLDIVLERGSVVSGRVTGPDGTPVAGVLVAIEASPAWPALALRDGAGVITGADGEYEIAGVEAGRKTIRFSKEGLLNETKTIEVAGAEVRADVRLGEGRSARGRVVDGTGAPVAGAHVRVWNDTMRHEVHTGQTDTAGRFSIDGLARAFYAIEIAKEGYAVWRLLRIDPYGEGELRVTLCRGAIVHGRVSGAAGKRAEVFVRSGEVTRRAPIGADGTYRIDAVPPGSVTLQVIVSGARGASLTTEPARLTLRDGDAERVDFELGSEIARGRVMRDGQPVADAEVILRHVERDSAGETRAGNTVGMQRTAASGVWEFDAVDEGTYRVSIRIDRASAPFAVECTIPGPACDADLAGAPLAVTVVDAETRQPVPNARVHAASLGDFTNYSPLQSNAAGVARLEFVPAGTFTLVVGAGDYPSVRQNMEIGTGGEEQMEVALQRGLVTELRLVENVTRRPVEGRIDVEAIDAPPVVESRFHARGGIASLALPPGRYRILATSSGFAPRTLEVRVPQQRPIEIPFTIGGDITVVSESGVAGPVRITRKDIDSPLVARALPRACRIRPGGHADFLALEPGVYLLELLDEKGRALRSTEVTLPEDRLLRIRW